MFEAKRQPNGSNRSPSPNGADLTVTLYEQLHRLAEAWMLQEYGPRTLQATALVHEAWLRLGGDHQPGWEDRSTFLAAAAKTMRRILIDRARYRMAVRHGGGQKKLQLEDWNWEKIAADKYEHQDKLLMALDVALRKLSTVDNESAELIELKYFGGMQVSQLATLTGLSHRTAERRLRHARAWLRRSIQSEIAC